MVISDKCFCQYTDHGYFGIISSLDYRHYVPAQPLGYLHNDHTLDRLQQASVAPVQAGADMNIGYFAKDKIIWLETGRP